jgi:serine/threonine protein kinase
VVQDGSLVLEAQAGQILAGKYRIDRVLGAGGMGTVVAAYHLQLDTNVAVKFLRSSLLTNHEAVTRFMQEARAVTRMNNEHVARVFDVGTLPTGAPYMVMEYLDGADMADVLRQVGRLEVSDAVDFVLQACEAIAHAHALGIVHRDLKPTNLFYVRRLDGHPFIKVLDFGISKVIGAAAAGGDQSLTQTSSVMGTPFYMSPEQLEAPQTVDERTDIWALGVILYEFLAGIVPFTGDSLSEVSVKVAARAPRPLSELRPDVPAGLTTIIDGCLQKNRDQRYRDVAELARALLPFGSSRASHSVERVMDTLQPAGRSNVLPAISGSLESAGPAWSAGTAMIAKPRPSVKIAKRRLRTLPVAGAIGLVAVMASLISVAHRGRAQPASHGGARQPAPAAVNGAGPARATAQIVVLPLGGSPARPGPPPRVHPPITVATAEARGPAERRAPDRVPGRAPGRSIKPGRPQRSSGMAVAPPSGAVVAVSDGPPRPPAPKGDCPVTFEVDAQGRKHFNRECLAARPAPAAGEAAPASSPSCSPNFDLDDQGRKHFKPDCFVNARQ